MTRPDLAEAALHELRIREVKYPQEVAQQKRSADEAGRGIAAWRSIVALLRDGAVELEPCLGVCAEPRSEDCPRRGSVGWEAAQIKTAWLQLVDAAHQAAEHRLRVSLRSSSPDAERQMLAIRQVRDILVRSAIRAGAEVPSFDANSTSQKAAA